MIKYLVLLAVVALIIWWLRRGRGDDAPPRQPAKSAENKGENKAENKGTTHAGPGSPAPAMPMLACAHCGVHLPQAEAVVDAGGRPFCGEAHRLAGPR